MNGFMAVIVEPATEAARCHICRQVRPLSPAVMSALQRSAFGLHVFCLDCQHRLGGQEMERIITQVNVEDKQRAQDSLSNGGG